MNADTALSCLRGVATRCLQQILKAGCPGGKIPKTWVDQWQAEHKLDGSEADQRIAKYQVPAKRGHQMRLLRLMMDEDGRKSRIRHSTNRLLDAVFNFSNYGAHAGELGDDGPFSGEEVSPTFLIVACLTAVELCHQLKRDLQ